MRGPWRRWLPPRGSRGLTTRQRQVSGRQSYLCQNVRISTASNSKKNRRSFRLRGAKRRIAGNVEVLREGDPLIASILSRLGLSMLESMEVLSVASDANISVYAMKGSRRLEEHIQCRIIDMDFSVVAEIKGDLFAARTKGALRATQVSSRPLVRPTGPGKGKFDPFRPEIEPLLANGLHQRFTAKRYNTTLENLAKRDGEKRDQDAKGLSPVVDSVAMLSFSHTARELHQRVRFDLVSASGGLSLADVLQAGLTLFGDRPSRAYHPRLRLPCRPSAPAP